MSCSQAHRLIFAECDGPLDSTQRAHLDEHIAQCPACGRMRAGLAHAIETWRISTTTATAPDATQEWYALRPKLREEKKRGRFRFPRLATIAWIGVPTAAVAALAFAFYSPPAATPSPSVLGANAKVGDLACAEFVDVPGNSASTVVYVDNASGWLVVWADTPGKG